MSGPRRISAVAALGVRRTIGRLTGVESKRVLLAVVGVAVAVALMTSVTGIALGLASQSAIQSESVDYWVVPEGSSVSSVAVSMQGPRLGDTHRATSRLAADSRIEYVTPVLIQVVSLRTLGTDRDEYVVLLGIVPPASGSRTIAGLSTASLTGGDPYFANGSYDGTWTGELVLSDAAADLLDASTGDVVAPRTGGNRSFTVTTVSRGDITTGLGPAPVGLVHLGELQAATGATADDSADQLLVSTDSASVRTEIERLYPQSTVLRRAGFSARTLSPASLSLAMGAAGFLIALVVGVLFVATMMGLEVTADRRMLAVLAALGFSERSRGVLIVSETLTLSVAGGVLGVLGGGATIVAVNAAATRYLGVQSIALFHPLLAAYGVGVALLIGLIAVPYPILLARRSDLIAVIHS